MMSGLPVQKELTSNKSCLLYRKSYHELFSCTGGVFMSCLPVQELTTNMSCLPVQELTTNMSCLPVQELTSNMSCLPV